MVRIAFALAALPWLVACPKQVPLPKGPPQPIAFKLLTAVPEAETGTRTEQRQDVFIQTDQFEHTPVIVAKGEAGPMSLMGGRAQLFSDEAATKGVDVDNFILFEVLDMNGKVTHRFTLGFHTGVTVDNQQPDNVGASKFTFEPGIDISSQLPLDAQFSLRATALDYGGVGRVSDVYVVVSAVADRALSDDELKNR